jgi:hypothetical protein
MNSDWIDGWDGCDGGESSGGVGKQSEQTNTVLSPWSWKKPRT